MRPLDSAQKRGLSRFDHRGDPLTGEQVQALKHGTEVMVTWSGGNGPWPYRIIRDKHQTVCTDNLYQDPLLSHDGALFHRVTLGWGEAEREHYEAKR